STGTRLGHQISQPFDLSGSDRPGKIEGLQTRMCYPCSLLGFRVMPPQVREGALDDFDVVSELAEAGVAVEAEHAANLPGDVVMVNMRPVEWAFAYQADSTLRLDHRRDLCVSDSVAPHQVIMPSATVEPLP